MAFSTELKYIGEFIKRELGIGTYFVDDVAQGDTEARLCDPTLADPNGGTFFIADSYFTYTAMNGDLVTGIPASGDGSIPSGGYDGFGGTSPDIVYLGNVTQEDEIETYLKLTKSRVLAEILEQDEDKKLYWTHHNWFDENVELRDDNDDSYNVITPNTSDPMIGEFSFTTARTENQLYVVGWRYNPFYVLADMIEMISNDDRRFTYFSIGQSSMSKKDLVGLAKMYRQRGAKLEF